MALKLNGGRIEAGPVTNLAAAGIANAVAVYTLSTFANMIGTKTLTVRRLMIRNNGAGNTFVHIGTGVGVGVFVDALAPFWSINNTTDEYMWWELPRRELLATITSYPDALVVGTIDVQVEVEEIG